MVVAQWKTKECFFLMKKDLLATVRFVQHADLKWIFLYFKKKKKKSICYCRVLKHTCFVIHGATSTVLHCKPRQPKFNALIGSLTIMGEPFAKELKKKQKKHYLPYTHLQTCSCGNNLLWRDRGKNFCSTGESSLQHLAQLGCARTTTSKNDLQQQKNTTSQPRSFSSGTFLFCLQFWWRRMSAEKM